MPFDANVYRVLIASPSDVGEERNVIPELINEWNAQNTPSSKIILMPVRWETHSAPLLGNRPQAIINEQLKDCDMLVGVFWTRIGTHTGVSISGTVEEIEQFVSSKKPVMLYFSQSPIDPEKIDIDQFTALRKFKERMKLEGLIETYFSIPDFGQKFSRQLSFNVGNIIQEKAVTKETKPSTKKTATKTGVKKTESMSIGTNEKLSSEKVDEYLVKAVTSASNDKGWAKAAAVGLYLKTYTPIDFHDYGFIKLKDFLESRKIFEIETENSHPIFKVAVGK